MNNICKNFGLQSIKALAHTYTRIGNENIKLTVRFYGFVNEIIAIGDFRDVARYSDYIVPFFFKLYVSFCEAFRISSIQNNFRTLRTKLQRSSFSNPHSGTRNNCDFIVEV